MTDKERIPMDNIQITLNAVIPLISYVALGYFSRERGISDEKFFKEMSRVILHAFFPFVMFNNICQVDWNSGGKGKLILVVLCNFILVIAILLLIVPRLVRENEKRGVIIQGIFRSNSVLFAIPLTQSIYGQEGVTTASLILMFMIPLYNIMAVIVLEYYHEKNISLPKLLLNISKNPLIIGAAAGIVFSLLPVSLPGFLQIPIAKIADFTSPLALFALGGSLKLASIGGNLRYLVPSLSFKMLVLPAVSLGISRFFGFSAVETFVCFCLYATPVAAASYPMAQELGGDGELAGEFVIFSTILSGFTLFFWIYAMKTIGVF